METIRNYLVIEDLILNLDTKNEVDPDDSWSIPEGWKYKKEIYNYKLGSNKAQFTFCLCTPKTSN